MRQKNKIILLAIWLIICAALVSGVYYDINDQGDVEALCDDWEDMGYDDATDCEDSLDPDDLNNFNPREDDWYDVEDWEIEYCQREAPYDGADPDVTADAGFPYLSQVAYTMIGEYTNVSNEVTHEPLYMYEANYYVYPWDDTYQYAARLSHSNRTVTDPRYFYELVAPASATQNVAVTGYVPVYLPEWYDQVQLALKGTDAAWVTLTVPLINSNTGDGDADDVSYTLTGALPW